MNATRRAMLALPAAVAACGAVAVAETPFGTISGTVAEIRGLWEQRDALFNRYAVMEPNGRLSCSDPAYFAAIRPIEGRVAELTLRLARLDASTPHDVRLKATVAEAYHPFFDCEKGNPGAELLRGLFRDLGVAA